MIYPYKRKEIELAIAYKGRLRLLAELLKADTPLTKYFLIKKTGLKPLNVNKAIKIFTSLGWLIEIPCNPKKYMLNQECQELNLLKAFLKAVKYI
jgi:hypothetical protein